MGEIVVECRTSATRALETRNQFRDRHEVKPNRKFDSVLRCPYPLYFCTALCMHTKHCLLHTHARIHSLTWLAVPARPYYSHSCILQDYSSSTLVSTTLACPVVEFWVGNITGSGPGLPNFSDGSAAFFGSIFDLEPGHHPLPSNQTEIRCAKPLYYRGYFDEILNCGKINGSGYANLNFAARITFALRLI